MSILGCGRSLIHFEYILFLTILHSPTSGLECACSVSADICIANNNIQNLNSYMYCLLMYFWLTGCVRNVWADTPSKASDHIPKCFANNCMPYKNTEWWMLNVVWINLIKSSKVISYSYKSFLSSLRLWCIYPTGTRSDSAGLTPYASHQRIKQPKLLRK